MIGIHMVFVSISVQEQKLCHLKFKKSVCWATKKSQITKIIFFFFIDYILSTLTPKGPSCVFWQHSDFGQVRVTRDFIIFL